MFKLHTLRFEKNVEYPMVLRHGYVLGTHDYQINISATAHTLFRHSTDSVHSFQIAEKKIFGLSLCCELLRISICSLHTLAHAYQRNDTRFRAYSYSSLSAPSLCIQRNDLDRNREEQCVCAHDFSRRWHCIINHRNSRSRKRLNLHAVTSGFRASVCYIK